MHAYPPAFSRTEQHPLQIFVGASSLTSAVHNVQSPCVCAMRFARVTPAEHNQHRSAELITPLGRLIFSNFCQSAGDVQACACAQTTNLLTWCGEMRRMLRRAARPRARCNQTAACVARSPTPSLSGVDSQHPLALRATSLRGEGARPVQRPQRFAKRSTASFLAAGTCGSARKRRASSRAGARSNFGSEQVTIRRSRVASRTMLAGGGQV
jgi:hypothetical protein